MGIVNETKDAKQDLIGFAPLVEQALRGVVREALRKVARDGLPGNHHFYITCRTGAEGVELPPFLRERFPEEITLVLQHQFWDLAVGDETFSVSLSFSGKTERLRIPFEAVTGFVDPSIDFGLQFKAPGAAEATAPMAAAAPEPAPKDEESSEPKVVKLDSFRRG
jgi:hypothetical protein